MISEYKYKYKEFENENIVKVKGMNALKTDKVMFKVSKKDFNGNILILKSNILNCKISIKFNYDGNIENKQELENIYNFLGDIIKNN